MNASEDVARGSGGRATALVLGLALLLRVGAAWGSWAKMAFFSRGLEMSNMADALVRGKGLSSPFGGETGPTAMFAAVYPGLVACFFRVFGSRTTAAGVGIVALQIVVNLVAIWLMMKVARREFGARAGLVAGLIWTLAPPLWWLPTIYWDTTITLTLLVGMVALALRVVRVGGLAEWIEFGGFCGVAALFNPALLPTLAGVFAVVAVVCWRRGGGLVGRRAGLAAVVFVVVFSVWPIRNARVLHAFVALRTAAGLDLWMGNHDGASGYLESAQFPIYNQGELRAYVSEGEIGYTGRKGAEARSYIAGHPGSFMELTARRFARFWMGSGSRDGSALFVVQAVATTALGFAGLWMLVRRRRYVPALVFAVPLLLFPLPYYITHAEFRFRLVVDPLMTMLAGYALVSWFAEATTSAPSSRAATTSWGDDASRV